MTQKLRSMTGTTSSQFEPKDSTPKAATPGKARVEIPKEVQFPTKVFETSLMSKRSDSSKSRLRSVVVDSPSSVIKRSLQQPNSIFSLMQSNEFNVWKKDQRYQRKGSLLDLNVLQPIDEMQTKPRKKRKLFTTTAKRFSFHSTSEVECESPGQPFQLSSKAFVHKVNQIFYSQHQSPRKSSVISPSLWTPSQPDIRMQYTLESSLNDEQEIKWKSQLTSPRLTFNNQLSVIPPSAQAPVTVPQNRTEQSLNVIMEAIDNDANNANIVTSVNNLSEQPPSEKKKDRPSISIAVHPPLQSESERRERFYIPDHFREPIMEHQDEETREIRPKNMLKHAIQAFMSKKQAQPKASSILKLIHQNNDGSTIQNKYDGAILVASKVKRYLKLYLQNRLQRTLEKQEFTSLFLLQLINEKKPIHLLTQIILQQSYDAQISAATSRMFTGLTVMSKEDGRTSIRVEEVRFWFEFGEHRFDASKMARRYIIDSSSVEDRGSQYGEANRSSAGANKWLYNLHETSVESDLVAEQLDESDDDTFHNDQLAVHQSSNWQTVSCADKSRSEAAISPIISMLDDESRNMLLSETSTNDRAILQQIIDADEQEVKFRQISLMYCNKQGCVPNTIIEVMYKKYQDIITGEYEDYQELSGMNAEYGVLAFDESQKRQQRRPAVKLLRQSTHDVKDNSVGETTNRLKALSRQFIQKRQASPAESVKEQAPTPTIKFVADPVKELQYQRQTTRLSPTNLSTNQQSTIIRARASESHSQNSLTPGVFIQKQASFDQASNQNSNESIKQEISNASEHRAQTEIKHPPQAKEEQKSRENSVKTPSNQERQGLSRQTSMAKFSLQMRTHISEAQRRLHIAVNRQISLLVLENKIGEINDLFETNPNILINERDTDGNTYLMMAAQSGFTKVALLLIEKGAAVNVQNNDGETALHKALAFSNYGVADLLINSGAQQNIRNQEGLTPWQLIK